MTVDRATSLDTAHMREWATTGQAYTGRMLVAAADEIDALDDAVVRFANVLSERGMPWVCHSDELAAVERAFARVEARG